MDRTSIQSSTNMATISISIKSRSRRSTITAKTRTRLFWAQVSNFVISIGEHLNRLFFLVTFKTCQSTRSMSLRSTIRSDTIRRYSSWSRTFIWAHPVTRTMARHSIRHRTPPVITIKFTSRSSSGQPSKSKTLSRATKPTTNSTATLLLAAPKSLHNRHTNQELFWKSNR